MIGAQVTRWARATNGSGEPVAYRGTVDLAGVHTETDDAPSERVHDDKDPVALEQNRLTAK